MHYFVCTFQKKLGRNNPDPPCGKVRCDPSCSDSTASTRNLLGYWKDSRRHWSPISDFSHPWGQDNTAPQFCQFPIWKKVNYICTIPIKTSLSSLVDFRRNDYSPRPTETLRAENDWKITDFSAYRILQYSTVTYSLSQLQTHITDSRVAQNNSWRRRQRRCHTYNSFELRLTVQCDVDLTLPLRLLNIAVSLQTFDGMYPFIGSSASMSYEPS